MCAVIGDAWWYGESRELAAREVQELRGLHERRMRDCDTLAVVREICDGITIRILGIRSMCGLHGMRDFGVFVAQQGEGVVDVGGMERIVLMATRVSSVMSAKRKRGSVHESSK